MQSWRWALGLTLLKALILAGSLAYIGHEGGQFNLCYWDCGYYQDIAQNGYRPLSSGWNGMAFFPFFPLLMRGLSALLPLPFAPLAIGFNLLCFGLALWLLMEWLKRLGFERQAWLPALLWTLDRHTLWAQLPYTEAIFSLLIVAFLWLGRKPWTLARAFALAALGGIASNVRMVGVSLVAALGLGQWSYFIRRPHWGVLCLLLGLSGVAAYFAWLQVAHGDWSMSLQATATWNRHFCLTCVGSNTWKLLCLGLFPTLLTLGFCVWGLVRGPSWLKLTPQERWLMFWLLFIPFASSEPISLPRYISVALLGHVLWGLWLLRVDERLAGWRRHGWRGAWALILLIEVFQQGALLRRYFYGNVAFWSG